MKIVTCLIITVIVFSNAFSQSAYHFNYLLPGAANDNLIDMLFLRFNNGNGIARIKFDGILIEMQAKEEYADKEEAGGHADTLFYRLDNPAVISGNAVQMPTPLLIVFTRDAVKDDYIPFGMKATGTHTGSVTPFKKNELVDPARLKDKTFVLQYFSKDDIFYKNLFEPSSGRGSEISNTNVKLILVAVANVNDPDIGSSCALDRDRVLKTFDSLSRFLAIRFEPVVISGNNYSKQNVLKALDDLHPGMDDIVIFYYSGHGFRKDSDTSNQYPYLDLRPTGNKDFNTNSLSLKNDVFEKIRNKGARLNLIISDCCNTKPEKINGFANPVPGTRGSPLEWNKNNCRKLFLDAAPVAVIANAAQPEEQAASNNQFGGFFSYFFKSSMEFDFSFLSLIGDDALENWNHVLESSRQQTSEKAGHTWCAKPYVPENVCKQTPVFAAYSKNAKGKWIESYGN